MSAPIHTFQQMSAVKYVGIEAIVMLCTIWPATWEGTLQKGGIFGADPFIAK